MYSVKVQYILQGDILSSHISYSTVYLYYINFDFIKAGEY